MMHDTTTAAGIGCIVYAAWLVHPALAWLVAGVALVAVGIAGARLKMWRATQEAKKPE